MKKVTLVCALVLMAAVSAFAQHRETLNLGDFDRVKLDGNIRLYIEEDREAEVIVEARKSRYFDDYRMEVRNGVLYIKYRSHDFGSTPKLKVYLTHPELKGIDMDGFIYLNSNNTITSESLAIKGDGFIRGTVAVDVQSLKVGLDGFCFMSFEGKATKSDLRLDGMGRINAKDLDSKMLHKSADGLAGIPTRHH